MKKCSTCKQLKDKSEFSRNRIRKDGLCYTCKRCRKIYYKEHKKEYQIHAKKWWKEHREEFLVQHIEYHKAHREQHAVGIKKWRKENPEKYRKIEAKAHAARYQNLGWIELCPNPLNDNEEIDWHHIDNIHVVSLPRDLHRLGGVYNNTSSEAHRINLSYIVDQIYGDLR